MTSPGTQKFPKQPCASGVAPRAGSSVIACQPPFTYGLYGSPCVGKPCPGRADTACFRPHKPRASESRPARTPSMGRRPVRSPLPQSRRPHCRLTPTKRGLFSSQTPDRNRCAARSSCCSAHFRPEVQRSNSKGTRWLRPPHKSPRSRRFRRRPTRSRSRSSTPSSHRHRQGMPIGSGASTSNPKGPLAAALRSRRNPQVDRSAHWESSCSPTETRTPRQNWCSADRVWHVRTVVDERGD